MTLAMRTTARQAATHAAKKRAAKLEAKGKTVDFKELIRMEPNGGTTNIRNVTSKHWKRWLGPESRCLVPFTSFSEYDTIDGKKVPVWFAPDESRPLLAFAGIWTNWTSVRKAKEGEINADIFAFLTSEPNAEVTRVHPKAMPEILTTTEEYDTAMGHGAILWYSTNTFTAIPVKDLALRIRPDGRLWPVHWWPIGGLVVGSNKRQQDVP